MIEIRSFRDLLRLLFIFKRAFVLTALATMILIVLGALFLPSRFTSTSRLFVNLEKGDQVRVPMQVMREPNFIQPATLRDPILDEEQILTSAPVISKVADAYRADLEHASDGSLWKRIKAKVRVATGAIKDGFDATLAFVGIIDRQTPQEKLAAGLAKALKVSHESGADVMELDLTWNDPTEAQQILKHWVDAYFDARAQAAGGAELSRFYENQSEELGKEVLALKQELHTKLNDLNAASLQQKLDSTADQLQRLYKGRQDALAQKVAVEAAIASAQQRLPSMPAEIVTGRAISLNPIQQDMQAKLNVMQTQRLDLLRTYDENAPKVKSLDAAIASMRTQIDSLAKQVQSSQNLAPNALALKLKGDIQDGETQEAHLTAQLDAIDKQIAALQSDRDHVLTIEPELSRLGLQLNTAEKAYGLTSEFLMHARVQRDLNANRLSNVAVVEPPTFVAARVFPKTTTMLLAALPAGIAVGLFAVFLCRLLDQRIHDGGGVDERFGLPLLGVVPELNGRAKQGLPLRSALHRIWRQLPHQDIPARGLTIGIASANPGEGVHFIALGIANFAQGQGYNARITSKRRANPGEVAIVEAPGVLKDDIGFDELQYADRIVVVVQARATTIPVVEETLRSLGQAFDNVCGIVLNRRYFEIPQSLMDRSSQLLRLTSS
ncbi:exopolysaccharide transport family protein [Rudaea sp.]|uniref:GumC family protein n=1 Tax=Rudaea sp. TaxID=2136325 RepID=UPI002ED6392C